MMLRVIFVYALVASAFITGDESPVNTRNLFGHDEIGLIRIPRDVEDPPECWDQGLECRDTYLDYESPFIWSIKELTAIKAEPGFVRGLCSAGHQMLECYENITDSCASTKEWFLRFYQPKIDWICNPVGIDGFARMHGTRCSSDPFVDQRARACEKAVCTMRWALACLRERYTELCTPAFAEFWIFSLMFPKECPEN